MHGYRCMHILRTEMMLLSNAYSLLTTLCLLTAAPEYAESAFGFNNGGMSNCRPGMKTKSQPMLYTRQIDKSHGIVHLTPNGLDEAEDTVGLAIAGGGTRAASAGFGILRGFQQKKIKINGGENKPAMEAFDYLSGVSGGAFPVSLYTFANISTNELLETDRSPNPEQITSDSLENIPATSIARTVTYTVPDLPWVLGLQKIPFAPRTWGSGFVYGKFFEPLGIPRNKYFAASEKEVDRIVKDDVVLDKDDFIWPRADTKAEPVLLFSMVGPSGEHKEFMKNSSATCKDAWFHQTMDEIVSSQTQDGRTLNMTKNVLNARPEYNGVTVVPYIATPNGVGTKYQSDTMKFRRFNLTFPEGDTKPWEWGRKSRFSIELATAMSGDWMGTDHGLLTIERALKGDDDKDYVLQFGDGGSNDYCGVLPLVQRKARKIVLVFSENLNPPQSSYSTTYTDIYKAAPSTDQKDQNFEEDFTTWLTLIDPRITCYFGYFGLGSTMSATPLNHVFRDPNLDRLKELMTKFNSLYKAGEPLIATLSDLKVIDNPFWGTVAGGRVDFTVIYFNMPKQFSSKVPIEAVPPPTGKDKIRADGQFTNKEMRVVPELPKNLGDEFYSKRRVNMMGYLGSWMVHHAWKPLRGHDSKVKFGGFEDVFRHKGNS